ncbi:MAG: DUF1345 domain-containing protein [Actinobacteria bacterium]|nr:DUF1345 domain-containing protein [Actinomycetota bacterium]
MSAFAKWIATEVQEWEAACALVFVVALQVLLAILSKQRHWELWTLPWWIWLVLIGPELALLAFLWTSDDPRGEFTLSLVMGTVNALALTALIGSVVGSYEHSGGQLLLKGVTVWATNVTAFGLAFWELFPKWGQQFRFPQQEEPGSDWKPTFFDYFYVSFTNSIAFSPTDAMPLTRRAKLLMMAESAVSAVTVLLVAARAVNIFN